MTRQWCQRLNGHRGKTSRLVPLKEFIGFLLREGGNRDIEPQESHTYLEHAAIVSKAFEVIGDAHSKLLGSRFHGAANHQAVSWLKHMQWAGDGGEGHGAHKDGHFLV